MHPRNRDIPLPLVFAAEESESGYFDAIDGFIRATLGEEASHFYQIICGDPAQVARAAKHGLQKVHRFRRARQEAYYFNWLLHIDHTLQQPFEPSHANMASLQLDADQPPSVLANQLRCAFSGIVAGNVKEAGIQAIEEFGPYQLNGDQLIMGELDKLLTAFAEQGRMKLGVDDYSPCYELVPR